MDRRNFLRATATVAGMTAIGGVGYSVFESTWVHIDRPVFAVPRLAASFQGLRIAFLTDIHHGPFTDLDYIQNCVRTANLLEPDVIVLGGDYSLKDPKYIRPCFEVLAGLKAPMGVFGVLGNHDYWHGVKETREGFRTAKITELTNTGVWLTRGQDRLRLAGVDDLWAGRPDVNPALADATATDACVLISHNPDFAETLTDRRVGLVLSGHTHGGQVAFPGFTPPWVPSAYGRKYLRGRVEAPTTQVYVSRGLGMAGVPIRVGNRPEINLVTLV